MPRHKGVNKAWIAPTGRHPWTVEVQVMNGISIRGSQRDVDYRLTIAVSPLQDTTDGREYTYRESASPRLSSSVSY